MQIQINAWLEKPEPSIEILSSDGRCLKRFDSHTIRYLFESGALTACDFSQPGRDSVELDLLTTLYINEAQSQGI